MTNPEQDFGFDLYDEHYPPEPGSEAEWEMLNSTLDRLAAGRRSSDPTVENPESVLPLDVLQRRAQEHWREIRKSPLGSIPPLPPLRFSKDDVK